MTPTIEPGRTAYEARFADERQGPRGTTDAWDDLPDSARAVWRRVEEAVRATMDTESGQPWAVLARIAGASPEPDDKEWYDPVWHSPGAYSYVGSDGHIRETGVDEGNAGDMDSFGYARGLHAAAVIARAALALLPKARTAEADHVE